MRPPKTAHLRRHLTLHQHSLISPIRTFWIGKAIRYLSTAETFYFGFITFLFL
jgi:hypothetical protein